MRFKTKFKTERIVLVTMICVLLLLLLPAIVFRTYYSPQINNWDQIESIEEKFEYGIVFGAGTYYGEPNKILKDRLDSAGELYEKGKISKLLISGSNIEGHEEVDVMNRYLIETYEIEENDIILDGFGLRTFNTCKRASEVYKIDEAILITSSYHIPRSIYLCEYAGIDSEGVGTSKNPYINSTVYIFRELLASHKALIDTLLQEPPYSRDIY